jgi:tetratricopeptide (TPR) repeat protein
MFELFISYRRTDAEHVRPLVETLRKYGVSVWQDQSEIGEFTAITDAIRHGLAESKALLAWYSEEYPQSRPCQMELTAALLAAQREGDPRRRVLVVNPAPSATHIEPTELRDAQHAAAPRDAAGYDALAQLVASRVAELHTPLGAILPIVPPRQYGLTLAGASRFVGRLTEFWRIHSALHASDSAIITGGSSSGPAIVSGLGGVGKSLLVEEYVLRFGSRYPGGVFWLRAHGNNPMQAPRASGNELERLEQFAAMAVAFGVGTKGLTPLEVQAELCARLDMQGQPFLWIVDDLASGLDAEEVKGWLAPHPLGRTLITTRSGKYGAIGTSLSVKGLQPEESFSLLCSRRRPENELEATAARDIARTLGHHPFALDVTGAALDAQAGLVSFAEFHANLADSSRDELELAGELSDEMLPTGHGTSVAATILRSVRVLPEEGRDFLRLAAVLAVEPIPPTLVVAVMQADGLSESEARIRAVSGQRQVENASLAERREGDARLVHVLVSRTMRFHDGATERSSALRAAAVVALCNTLPSTVADPRSHHRVALHVQHSRAVLDGPDLWGGEEATLAVWVARRDRERGLYAQALALLERAYETRRRVVGDEHEATLRVLVNLAETLLAHGDYSRARTEQERLLEIQQRVLGKSHPDTLTNMNNLAVTLSALGHLAEARDLQERVYEARRVLNSEDRETLISLSNLADTMRRQGDLAAARALQETALEMQRRVLGDDDHLTLMTASNLAETLREQGYLTEARSLQQTTLELRSRTLGDEHPDTLMSMNNLAGTLVVQGDLTEGRDLQERALTIFQRVMGETHPATLTSSLNLAVTLRKLGQLRDARDMLERALTACRRSLTENHPLTLAVMANLADALGEEGDLAGARRLLEAVLDTRRRRLGVGHEDTTMSAWSLAAVLGRLNDPLAGASALIDSLRWVLNADSASLTPKQRRVQQYLRDQSPGSSTVVVQ